MAGGTRDRFLQTNIWDASMLYIYLQVRKKMGGRGMGNKRLRVVMHVSDSIWGKGENERS